MIVDSILKTKGSGVYTIERSEQVSEAARILNDKRIGAAVVIDGTGAVCGVLSERDIVHGVATQGPTALTRPVSDLMTANVISCRVNHTIDQCMSLMTDRRIRHLPVIEEGDLKGIISIGDIVKWRIAETEAEANALKEYIATG